MPKSTGERLNGRTYRQIVQLAIQGEPINQIALQTNVVWRTAKAVVERESRPIAERKRELADACMRIAQHATERIEDNLHTAPFQSLPTIVGIMTDKVVALTSDPIQNQNLHIHLNAVDLIGSFNQMLDKLNPNTSEREARSSTPAIDVPIQSVDPRSATPKSPTIIEQESSITSVDDPEKRLLSIHESIKKTDSTQSQLEDSTPEQQ